jgi:hypothetical protein
MADAAAAAESTTVAPESAAAPTPAAAEAPAASTAKAAAAAPAAAASKAAAPGAAPARKLRPDEMTEGIAASDVQSASSLTKLAASEDALTAAAERADRPAGPAVVADARNARARNACAWRANAAARSPHPRSSDSRGRLPGRSLARSLSFSLA